MKSDPAIKSRPVTIGVAGGTGSGKTTVSTAILDRVGARHIAYLPHDAYYRDLPDIPRIDNEIVNFDHPDALDTSMMIGHIQQLQRGEPVNIPVYDFSIHSRAPHTQRIEPQPIILVEGILIFVEPALRALFDVRIFVDADADIRFIRRLQRDVSERDVIIPEGGYNEVAIAMLSDRISSLIAAREQAK